MANCADNLPAGRLDRLGGLFLEIVSERVIRGQKEPLPPALRDDGFAEAMSIGVTIVSPVDGVWGAFFACEQCRSSTGAGENLVFLFGHIRDRERDRRIREVENCIDVFVLVPATCDSDAH